MPLDDTSPKAREFYFQQLAMLTPAERINIGVELWKAADSLQRAALRRGDPSIDEPEISFRIAVSRFGLELASKAFRRS